MTVERELARSFPLHGGDQADPAAHGLVALDRNSGVAKISLRETRDLAHVARRILRLYPDQGLSQLDKLGAPVFYLRKERGFIHYFKSPTAASAVSTASF